jgi:hypothetical protein
MWTRDTYSAHPGERNDCSVRAFSVAACVPYQESYRLFAGQGRRPRRGTLDSVTRAVIATNVPTSRELSQAELTEPNEWRFKRLTIPQFAKKFNKGHFIVHSRTHALAVINGVIHDWKYRPRTQVWQAWQLV